MTSSAVDVLSVRNLRKAFSVGLFRPAQPVLKNVSFKLAKGTTTGFVGNNGSGKTTTIKCLFDFVRPDEGEVFFFGEKLTNQNKNRVGYLPERPYLYDFLTAEEFLRLHWQLCYDGVREGWQDRLGQVLERVGLGSVGQKKLRQFSKGMLQRIGIAQAILTQPELLILDEPMSGLDPDGRAMVKDILKDEQDRGTSLFFSSHLLADMDELCSHLVVIDQGQVYFSGELGSFKKEYRSLEQAFKVWQGEDK